MDERLTLGVERREGGTRLLSPGVGLFTGARGAGELLGPGQAAGVLLRLGRPAALIVPEGVRGVVQSERPERVREPVGWGRVLYELADLEAHAPAAAAGAAERDDGAAAPALVLRSPQTGRFWHRPSPAEPPFVRPGQVIESGAIVGLIEAMKTFAQVPYRAAGDLPARARVVRLLAPEGADVSGGQPLLEVEPA